MNIYGIPVIGWLIGLIIHTSMAIPFYFLWNGLAPTYFYWLPSVYLSLGFWNIVGLFVLITILRAILLPRFSSPPFGKFK